MTVREVRLTEHFKAQARKEFPPGGSPSGRPSYETFETTALPVAMRAFGHNFESLAPGGAPEESPTNIRYLVTICPPFIGSIMFVGSLVGTSVELDGLSVDENYWDLIDQDPRPDQ
jgi:hypothetical protein